MITTLWSEEGTEKNEMSCDHSNDMCLRRLEERFFIARSFLQNSDIPDSKKLSLPIKEKSPKLSTRKWEIFYQDNAIPDIPLQTRRNRYNSDVILYML